MCNKRVHSCKIIRVEQSIDGLGLAAAYMVLVFDHQTNGIWFAFLLCLINVTIRGSTPREIKEVSGYSFVYSLRTLSRVGKTAHWQRAGTFRRSHAVAALHETRTAVQS